MESAAIPSLATRAPTLQQNTIVCTLVKAVTKHQLPEWSVLTSFPAWSLSRSELHVGSQTIVAEDVE